MIGVCVWAYKDEYSPLCILIPGLGEYVFLKSSIYVTPYWQNLEITHSKFSLPPNPNLYFKKKTPGLCTSLKQAGVSCWGFLAILLWLLDIQLTFQIKANWENQVSPTYSMVLTSSPSRNIGITCITTNLLEIQNLRLLLLLIQNLHFNKIPNYLSAH